MNREGKPWAYVGKYEVVSPHVRVIEVENRRKGAHYPPPTMHLGMPHPIVTPAAIGDSALAYLQKMLIEAEKLAS
jgi:hypothetical protein